MRPFVPMNMERRLEIIDCMPLVFQSHCGLALLYHDQIQDSLEINDKMTSIKAVRYDTDTVKLIDINSGLQLCKVGKEPPNFYTYKNEFPEDEVDLSSYYMVKGKDDPIGK